MIEFTFSRDKDRQIREIREIKNHIVIQTKSNFFDMVFPLNGYAKSYFSIKKYSTLNITICQTIDLDNYNFWHNPFSGFH